MAKMHCNVMNERDKGLRYALAVCTHTTWHCIRLFLGSTATKWEIFKYQPENGFSTRAAYFDGAFADSACVCVCVLRAFFHRTFVDF